MAVRARLQERRPHVAVTGATGWLGMAALEVLFDAFGQDDFDDHVSAWASTARRVALRSGRTVDVDALSMFSRDERPAEIVLHFAFLTRDRIDGLGVDAYLRANLEITHQLLDGLDRHRPAGLVYASSGAVYDGEGGPTGDVAGNPYGAAKRLDELAFRAAAHDLGASCVIPRIFSLTGPHMTKPNLYALGDMLGQARRGGPLRITAARPVRRSYVSIVDLLSVCLGAVLDPGDLLFDSGGVIVEMGELATTVREVVGPPSLRIERTWDPDAPADDYTCSDSGFVALAGKFGVQVRSLRQQVEDTAEDLVRRGLV